MTLTEFYAELRSAIKRGTSQDASLAGWAWRACRWLENNYSYDYMLSTARFTWDGTSDIALPTGFKSFAFVRVVTAGDDGTETYAEVPKVGQAALTGTQAEFQFYYTKAGKLYFDAVPAEETILDWSFYAYTDWDSLAEDDEPDILTVAHEAMLQHCLMLFAQDAKDLRMIEVYKGLRDEALSVELRADQEKVEAGQSHSMSYQPYY